MLSFHTHTPPPKRAICKYLSQYKMKSKLKASKVKQVCVSCTFPDCKHCSDQKWRTWFAAAVVVLARCGLSGLSIPQILQLELAFCAAGYLVFWPCVCTLLKPGKSARPAPAGGAPRERPRGAASALSPRPRLPPRSPGLGVAERRAHLRSRTVPPELS